jgi:Ring finger domain
MGESDECVYLTPPVQEVASYGTLMHHSPKASALTNNVLCERTRDQCSYILLSGKRCSRRVSPSISNETECWQHCTTYNAQNNRECAICMENVCRQRCILDCTHVFHRKCLRRWLVKGIDNCPLCRRSLSTYEMYILGVKRKQEYLLDTELSAILTVIDMLFDGLM